MAGKSKPQSNSKLSTQQKIQSGPKPSKKELPADKPIANQEGPAKAAPASSEWLQDASLEVPVPGNANFLPGERELEFSVGLRQQDMDGLVRSELRGRALVHAKGEVLVVVEASYVSVAPQKGLRADLPQHLYQQLRSSMENLLAITGHNPPLPPSLEKVA